ncbi:bleomycin resistance protein [Sediminibacterium soli]|uniref:bleomycin resistance protein n=1 Tax=Sediminibacterium soli TaxID=2698829 RepID=UPI00137A3EA7|nr:VOC family protein [Sediminibacterium soli]NCI45188.1 VOC family protein [Sediminibacterium soli]
MLTAIHPKLPMRDKQLTKAFYIDTLGFSQLGTADYPEYLMVKKDAIEIHFFLFAALDPKENYGQVYIRVNDIDQVYRQLQESGATVHPNGGLQQKPWGQKEFSLLDPDNNLLTFGETV